MRTGRAGTPRGARFVKWLAANTTPLAFVASALGCSLMVDPRSTQCSSDRHCAAFVENGREARCTAGYCQLLGDGSSMSGAAGTSDAGQGQAGSAGEAGAPDTNGGNAGSGSPSFGGATGTTADTGGKSPATAGSAAGASTRPGAGGASTGAGGLSAGGSPGGAAGSAAGGSEGAAGAPASTGGTGGGAGVSFGGSAGKASSGGNGASDGGAGGSTGSTTANGVMVLTVPLLAPGQGQRYNAHNTGTSAPYDLAGATLTLRAYAPGATGGNLHVFCSSRNFVDSAPTDIALSRLTDGFQDIDIPVPASAGGFQPTDLFIIRVEVEAGAGFGVSWRSPATVVYLDSIVSSNGVIVDTFDTPPASSTFDLSDSRRVPNSNLAWLPSISFP